MSQQYKPVVNVLVAPSKVSLGQMISIVASIHDANTSLLMTYDKIFLEIIDETGVPVWPLSTIEEDSATISKLISTAELKDGKSYTVRVSPSRKLSPIGTAEFSIEGSLPKALLIPSLMLIPEILLQTINQETKQVEKTDKIGPLEPPKISWLIFKTERDAKVCIYCQAHEGERWKPNDPDLPTIPIHPRCRCHYDIITYDVENEIYQAYLQKIVSDNIIMHEMAASAAMVHFEKHKRE